MTAIDAYQEAAQRFEAHIIYYPQRLERALQLALKLRKFDTAEKIAAVVDQRINPTGAEDGAFSFHLMRLLLRVYRKDPERHAEIARIHATAARDAGDLYRSETWWKVVSDWLACTKDKTGVRSAAVERAEDLVARATNRPGLASVSFLSRAIEILRTVPETEARVAELHLKLLDAQREARQSATTIESEPIDISDWTRHCEQRVADLTLSNALEILAFAVKVPRQGDLEAQAKDHLKSSVLQYHVTRVRFSSGNRRLPEPKIDPTCPEALESEGREYLMHRLAQQSHAIAAVATIEPMRQRILLDHSPRIQDMLDLVDARPFVPPTRRLVVATGLYRGLVGDFIEAGHILVPQLENGIRTMFIRKGVITTSLENDLSQSEVSINALLEHDRANDVFGSPDLVFNLRGFLSEKAGSNLRHNVAHALLEDDEMLGHHFTYAWWLMLHLIHRYEYTSPAGSETEAASPDPTPASEVQ